MKFYIGSGFSNCGLVDYYVKILEENGWSHTYDWTKNVKNDVTNLVSKILLIFINYLKLSSWLGLLMKI